MSALIGGGRTNDMCFIASQRRQKKSGKISSVVDEMQNLNFLPYMTYTLLYLFAIVDLCVY